eukprot:346828-Amphidinium_carterae.1
MPPCPVQPVHYGMPVVQLKHNTILGVACATVAESQQLASVRVGRLQQLAVLAGHCAQPDLQHPCKAIAIHRPCCFLAAFWTCWSEPSGEYTSGVFWDVDIWRDF